MNFRKTLIYTISALMVAGAAGVGDADAARKRHRSKSRTSQSWRNSKKKKTRNSRYKTHKAAPAKPAEPKEEVLTDSLTMLVNGFVLQSIPADCNPGGLRVNSVRPDMKRSTVKVGLNEDFTYMPVNRETIENLRKTVIKALPDSLDGFDVTLSVGNRSLAYYINKIDKLPESARRNIPFVTAVKPYIEPKKGMEGDIIALWSSHGRYYKNGAWQWQRPLLFQSVEDTYTMGYVLPYLVPMLENAGAYVMMPRERDINRNEVIVDNDINDGGMLFSQTTYREQNGSRSWVTGEGEGFIYDLPDFRDTENPFENGTYRQVQTVRGGKPAVAAWYADIPEEGEYAVYVSYKTLPNSTSDARYTVNYSGGSREFKVNQQMGGGTWIYLGTFPLQAGADMKRPVVTLTNISEKGGEYVVTADAVKIGGGMGNIARSPHRSDIYYDPSTPDNTEDTAENDGEEESDETAITENDVDGDGEAPADNGESAKSDKSDTAETKKGPAPVFRTSVLPRYLEGARYWMHWAGAPESVYSPFHGSNDYKDDYTGRGHWVNWLAGGSRVLPNEKGLNIPVDITFALHSDAGKKADDSFVGTLGIYYTNNGDSYKDGTPRINSRMLTNLIMSQITADIRKEYAPSWRRRQMWDKSYLEARVPEVPTTLIELMSHQNFADMQYGLDPSFKFAVARAIYKGMARFLGERKDRQVVIQPLPVRNFAIQRTKKEHFRLSWQPTPDPLESTAMPTKYIILERVEGNLGFQKAGETTSTHFDVKVADDLIHSYRIVAANEGGQSFPSETLALRESPEHSRPILIVNGFSRVSGPEHFTDEGRAGFDADADFGVPYIREISFTGRQTEYRRNAGDSFGRSSGNYIGRPVAGNTFDFAALHGEGVAEAGYAFVSCSADAVQNNSVRLDDYKIVDLILGRQKTTVVGSGNGETSKARFAAFPPELRSRLETFVKTGGDLIISGEKAISDLYNYRSGSDGERFANEVLGARIADIGERPSGYAVSTVANAAGSGLQGGSLKYSDTFNEEIYAVQHPDILEPTSSDATVFMTYDNGGAAGIATRTGKGRVILSAIPLETITDDLRREQVIKALLKMAEK